jgi:hypothetical protein
MSSVANTRIDDHVPPGNTYLVDIRGSVIGDYTAVSLDPENVGGIHAHVTADGNYSTDMYDAAGNHNKAVHGGMKLSANSRTKTITGHEDIGVGGGVRENFGTGHFKSVGTGSSYAAIDGPHITASAQNHMSLSPGGDGHHAMSGDQSFVVQNGGIHHSVDQDFTVTALGVVHHAAGKEYSIQVDGNEGHTSGNSVSFTSNNKFIVNAVSDITITSTTSITLQVGQSSIVITPTGITINTSGTIYVNAAANVYINSTSQAVVTNGSIGTFIQGGGISAPPTTFS